MRWNTILLAAQTKLTVVLFSALVLSHTTLADYAWIPKYDNLWTKFGFDYFSSKENIGSDGERNDITYQSRLIDYTEYKFWAEAEYGIARDISAFIKPTFLWNSINPITGTGTGLPNGGGISDLFVGFKWNPVKSPVLFTPEVLIKIPTYGTSDLTSDQLALGDGDFSVGTVAHLGYRATKFLVFGFSPGFVYRSSNYRAQVLLDGMVAFIYKPVFVRLFWNWKIGMGKEAPVTVITNNAEPGSGASFARLSKDTDLLSGGVKFGFNFHENYRVDLNFQQGLTGNRAPYYWQLGLNFYAPFDFYHEEKRIKVREVPFDSEQPPENG